ncbi:MAG: hypothetical protein JO134_19350 [Xanthobacteraceae bacterium]|nr:hypothetical protein [Xanthobacteraceae bacterium]MBV9568697.1 hypothetical protein [Hyphomicrobiales bacterium]
MRAMTAMTIKPIIDVQHCGKRVRMKFATVQRGIGMKYDIIVNEKPIKVGIFAEEVMRWLGDVISETTEKAGMPGGLIPKSQI